MGVQGIGWHGSVRVGWNGSECIYALTYPEYFAEEDGQERKEGTDGDPADHSNEYKVPVREIQLDKLSKRHLPDSFFLQLPLVFADTPSCFVLSGDHLFLHVKFYHSIGLARGKTKTNQYLQVQHCIIINTAANSEV